MAEKRFRAPKRQLETQRRVNAKMVMMYLRHINRIIRTQQLGPLPEAVQWGGDGAGHDVIEDVFDVFRFKVWDAGAIAQVLQPPLQVVHMHRHPSCCVDYL